MWFSSLPGGSMVGRLHKGCCFVLTAFCLVEKLAGMEESLFTKLM